MNQKPHISPSQLNMLSRCGEQYRRRYVENQIIPPGIAACQGSGIHVGAQTNFTQKIESHRDLPESDIVDASIAGMEERIKQDGISLTPDEKAIGQDKLVHEAVAQTVELARLHAREQAPEYQPVEHGVEHWSRIVVPNATHDLVGVTDLIDDQDRIVDIKTAGKTPSHGTADKSLQLTFYAASFRIENKRDPQGIRLDTLVKTKKPKRHVDTTTRGPADYKALTNRINTALAIINHGVFSPADPAAWWCSQKWCGYYATCPFVNGSTKQGD